MGRTLDFDKLEEQKKRGSYYLDNQGRELSERERQEKDFLVRKLADLKNLDDLYPFRDSKGQVVMSNIKERFDAVAAIRTEVKDFYKNTFLPKSLKFDVSSPEAMSLQVKKQIERIKEIAGVVDCELCHNEVLKSDCRKLETGGCICSRCMESN